MKIILIRHGQTNINKGSGIHAFDDNESLNAEGIKQVKSLIKPCLKLKIKKVFTSSAARAIQTASSLCKGLQLRFDTSDLLLERNWGNWQNDSWTEISERLNSMNDSQRYHFVPPKGESWQDLDNRLKIFINKVLNEDSDGIVTIISHGGTIRALMRLLLEQDIKNHLQTVDNASISILNKIANKFTLDTFNNVDHLN